MRPPTNQICGQIEVMSALAMMPIEEGFMCSHEANVLRDTGCNTVVARKDLIPKECFTGRHKKVRLVNGHVEQHPLAIFNVRTPYNTGPMEVVCRD